MSQMVFTILFDKALKDYQFTTELTGEVFKYLIC